MTPQQNLEESKKTSASFRKAAFPYRSASGCCFFALLFVEELHPHSAIRIQIESAVPSLVITGANLAIGFHLSQGLIRRLVHILQCHCHKDPGLIVICWHGLASL